MELAQAIKKHIVNRMRNNWLTRTLLEKVMHEAKKRGAAVFRIDGFTGGNKFKSLIFTVLSARTKDEATLSACEKLFSKFKNAKELARAGETEIEKLVYGVGFYRNKAKYVRALSKKLLANFKGKVPSNFDSLISLPGVGRKTANVVLAHAFGKDTIGVDVHVNRISNRLGIVKTKKPEETEMALLKIIPKKLRKCLNIAFVSHGQTVCLPRVPLCTQCVLWDYCKRIRVKNYR